MSLSVVAGASLILAAGVIGANLSGRWDLMMDPDFKGNPSIEHCLIKQQNQKLTVKCGSAGAAMDGEVNGEKVAWRFQTRDRSLAAWSGQLDGSGTSIKGTWRLTLADGYQLHGKFTARRRSH